MKYSQGQVEAVAAELQKRYTDGEAEGMEIIVALVSMHKAGRLDNGDLKYILQHVFANDQAGLLRSLQLAADVIDREMIDDIVREATGRC